MKILFSLSFYSPYISGLTCYISTLAPILAKQKDYQVSVMCMKHDRRLPDAELIDGVRVVRANTIYSISRGFISLDWLTKSVKQVNNCDVVVINLPQAEGIIPAVAAKLSGKKIVSIYHARVVLRGGITDKIIEKFLDIINLLVMKLSDKVVFYTDSYAKSLPFFNKIKNKYAAVYPPIRIPKSDEAISASIRADIPKGVKVVVGMVARLAEDKGFEFIIEAYPLLERYFGAGRVAVAVLGPTEPVGESKYRDKIMNLVKNGFENFKFLGTIDNDYMGSFYRYVDVFVVPSILESFSIVQAEAMMSGVPVVTSNIAGANVPINRIGMGKLVSPGNSRELADAIIDVYNKRNDLAGLQDKARKEFDFRNTVKYYLQMFASFGS